MNLNTVPFGTMVPPCPSSQGQGQQQMASNLNPNPLPTPLPPQTQTEGAQQFCLRWNSYPATVATQLATLRAQEEFVDVTLACDGKHFTAHKLVLSACSPYFMQLFKSTPCQHPVIFLRDVGYRQLEALLDFMYAGEVNVSQAELPALLRTAEALQVRGLADTTANNNNNNNTPSQPKPTFSPHYGQMGQPVIPAAQPDLTGPLQTEVPLPNGHNGQQMSTQQQVLPPVPPVTSVSTSTSSSASTSIQNFQNVPQNIKHDRSSVDQVQKNKEEDSESNDSNDFDMIESLDQSKEDYLGETNLREQVEDTGQVFPDPSALGFDLGDGDGGDLGEEEGEESSEVSDDDDGECKEFTYQSDASYSQEGEVNTNGENLAGPSGLGVDLDHPEDPDNPLPLNKEGSASGTGSGGASGRNRLSRSLWPPGIPYHGPQQCPYCPRVLSNVGNWRKHVLTMHFAREKVYKCRHCSSSFRTQEYLQKHYVRVHNYPQKMTRRKYAEQT